MNNKSYNFKTNTELVNMFNKIYGWSNRFVDEAIKELELKIIERGQTTIDIEVPTIALNEDIKYAIDKLKELGYKVDATTKKGFPVDLLVLKVSLDMQDDIVNGSF